MEKFPNESQQATPEEIAKRREEWEARKRKSTLPLPRELGPEHSAEPIALAETASEIREMHEVRREADRRAVDMHEAGMTYTDDEKQTLKKQIAEERVQELRRDPSAQKPRGFLSAIREMGARMLGLTQEAGKDDAILLQHFETQVSLFDNQLLLLSEQNIKDLREEDLNRVKQFSTLLENEWNLLELARGEFESMQRITEATKQGIEAERTKITQALKEVDAFVHGVERRKI